MSEPIALISSAAITQEEFTRFLATVGAMVRPDEVFDGRLSQGERHIWIVLDNRGLDEWEPAERAAVEQKLGRQAQTYIIVEISHTEGSEQIAVEFVCAFAKYWPCVVDNLRGAVYTVDELREIVQ